MDYVIFILGLSALIYGADFVVKESERIALHFAIPPFIIGATLIAVGTSLPEMAASITASYHEKSEIAVANVMGSVTFNITLVLGIIFLIAKKIKPQRDIFAKDSAWAIIPLFIFILMIFDGTISRFEGLVFLILMLGYLLFLVHDAKELLEVDEALTREKFLWPKTLGFLAIGFLLIIFGADYTIESATHIATSLGVSEWIIGLFLISFGTSLPELMVSIVAVKKGNADMSIGNIIGSNVANFTMVLGGAALVSPLSINLKSSGFDILVTIIASLMLLFITANKLYNKSAGIALLSVLALFLYNSISHIL